MPSISSLGLEEKIGQMLIVGFPAGDAGIDVLRGLVERRAAGNVIIFSRNVCEPSALRARMDEVRSIITARTGIPPLVSVDQEGGIVARVRAGVTPIPGAMAQAAAVGSGLYGLESIRALGRIAGTELHALGFDWNFAPDADVNVNPANPVIGVRSYGEEADSVAALCAAFAEGLADAGILATAKHFPGHGDTSVDSHLGLPLVPHSLERLDSVELVPFKRLISSGVAAVMLAHVRFPAIEREEIPATLSRKVIVGLLRERLGFKGLVTSDCMEMKAIAGRFPDAAVQAVEAGVDLLILSHTLEVQEAAAASIAAAVRSGRIPESRIDEAVSRILSAKASLSDPPDWTRARLAEPSSISLVEGMMSAALTVLRDGKGLPPQAGSIYVDIEPEGLSGAELAGGEAAVGSVAAAIRALSADFETITLAPDPDEATRKSVLERAMAFFSRRLPRKIRDSEVGTGDQTEACDIGNRADGTFGEDTRELDRKKAIPGLVFGSHNAKSNPGQVALARDLAALCAAHGRPFALVSMRSPYDGPFLEAAIGRPIPTLCSYEYTPLAARRVALYLSGGAEAPGTAPVTAYRKPECLAAQGDNA